MNTGDWNKKYIIGNIVIGALVIYWLFFVLRFAGTVIETLQMVVVSIVQAALFAAGWRYFIISPEKIDERKLVCTEPVSAVLVDYAYRSVLSSILSVQSEQVATKYAMYTFEWDGSVMTVVSDFQYCGVVKRGLPSEILVNPKNPNEIFEPQVERSLRAKYRFKGTICMWFGLISVLYMFGGDDLRY